MSGSEEMYWWISTTVYSERKRLLTKLVVVDVKDG